jgi:hypothetical protein
VQGSQDNDLQEEIGHDDCSDGDHEIFVPGLFFVGHAEEMLIVKSKKKYVAPGLLIT